MLTKSVPMQVKDLDLKQGIYTGYFSVFNTPDDGEPPDIVEPGAFIKTFAEMGPVSPKPRIKNLWMHDPFSLVGKPLKLEEHSYGAYHETKVAGTLGRDCLELLDEGVITEMSFGYDVLKAAFDKGAGVRRLKEVRAWEYSLVTWGMHSGTMITGTKSLPNPMGLAEQMGRVEKLLRRGNLQSEELLEAMELSVKQWRVAVQELETKAAQPPPEPETIVVAPPVEEQKGGTETMPTPNPDAKSKDFQTLLTQGQIEENLYQDWWLLIDTVRTAIRGILADAATTDKAVAAAASLDQFKSAMVAWVTRAVAAGLWADEQKAAAFLAQMEHKAGGPAAETKEGRVLSDANRKKVNDTLAALTGAAESLQALLTATEPATKATQNPAEPPKSGNEPGATPTPAVDPATVSEIKAMLAGIRAEVKGVTG